MSYDAAVYAGPVPEDDVEAWALVEAASDAGGPVRDHALSRLIERLTAEYPNDEIGPWPVMPLTAAVNGRVAEIPMAYSAVGVVLPFLVRTAHTLELTVFDRSSSRVHRPGGFNGLSLQVEDEACVYSPTRAQIEDAVDRMTPRGGPSFAIIEGLGRHYAQTAGGDGRYTVEWREYGAGSFRHWVAGHAGVTLPGEVKIPTNGFYVAVERNELLDAHAVKRLLMAFAEGRSRPEAFVWRDITGRFGGSADA
jgi:hypothetical protein